MNVSQPAGTAAPGLRARALSSFRSPGYRYYFFGTVAHFAAMSMQIVTGPLLMYRLTGSAALLGTMSLVHAFPMIFISLFGGAIADRIPKKLILVTGTIASAMVSLAIGLAITNGYISQENPGSWWVLILVAVFMGIIMGMMMPSLQAIIPEIVSREELMNAVALNQLGMNLLSLLAPGVAGFMIDAFDFASVYYAMTGAYLTGALLLSLIRTRRGQAISWGGNILAEIQQGFRYIRKHALISFVLVFTLVIVVLSMPYQQLLPIFTDDILKVGATGLGMIMSVSGAGALVGSIILAALPNKKRGLLLLGSGIIAAVALIVFSFSTVWIISLVFIFFVGISQTLRMTIGSTLLQTYSEAAFRGRVMSIMGMQWGVMSIFTFVAGIVADIVPVQWVLGSMAIVLLVFSILAMVLVRDIRRLD